jgi:phosphoribosylaminoimidazole (AIR) synthetase
MGVGFCLVVPEHVVDEVIRVFKAHGFRAMRIGEVIAEPRVEICLKGEKLVYA